MNSRLEDNLRRLYKLQRGIDELNVDKNRLREEIMDQIVDLKLEGKKFTVGDRKLSYNRRTVTQPLTNKYLQNGLRGYFDRKTGTRDLEMADKIYDYLMENRKRTSEYSLEFVKVPPLRSSGYSKSR